VRTIKKKVLNSKGKEKLGAIGEKGGSGSSANFNSKGRSNGLTGRTYTDKDGNLRNIQESKDSYVSEKPPYTTQMVTSRLSRVQTEVNLLENNKHNKFNKGDVVEYNCRDEMEKLCNLLANILGKISFGDNKNLSRNVDSKNENGNKVKPNNVNDEDEIKKKRNRNEEEGYVGVQ